jgi:hypothetical protein
MEQAKGYTVKADYRNGAHVEVLIPAFERKADAESLAKRWRESPECVDAWTEPVALGGDIRDAE